MMTPKAAHKALLSLAARETLHIRSILKLAVGVNLFLLAIPLAIQSAVNQFTLHLYSQPTLFLLIAFLGLLFAASVMRLAQTRLVESLQRRVFSTSLIELVENLQRSDSGMKAKFFESVSFQKAISGLLIDGFQLALQTALGLLLISFYHPIFFVYSFLLAVSLYGVVFVLGRGALDAAIQESKKKYSVSDWLDEIVSNPVLFKGDAAKRYSESRTASLLAAYLEKRDVFVRLMLRQEAALLLISVIASVLLLGVGGWLVVRDTLSLGQLVATELIITNILLGLFKFSKLLGSYYSAAVAAGKMESDSGTHPALEGAGGRLELSSLGKGNAWEFSKLTLQPVGALYPAVSDLSLKIDAGERISILAPVGGGKTSLFRSMTGFLEPAEGAVRVDGHEVSSYRPGSLRNSVMLFREVEVFSGSVRENISLGNPDLEPEVLVDALQKLGAWESINAIEGGLSAELDGSGHPLSTASLKAIMLSRAMIHKPSTLILDGFMESFEMEQAKRILEVLSAPEYSWTLIVGTTDSQIAALAKTRRSL